MRTESLPVLFIVLAVCKTPLACELREWCLNDALKETDSSLPAHEGEVFLTKRNFQFFSDYNGNRFWKSVRLNVMMWLRLPMKLKILAIPAHLLNNYWSFS